MSVRAPELKRRVKRWARRGLAGASRMAGIGRDGRLTPGVRILTFHRIADDPADPFAVAPVEFRFMMEAVAASGAVVPLEDALEGIERGGDPGPRVVLTFDDGTRDFLAEALPVLTRLGLPATLYVIPGRVGTEGFLGWEDLRTVGAAGVRIGSHGLDHRSLGALGPDDAWRQVSRSREVLEDRLGAAVTTLAYPYGTVRDYNEPLKRLVARAGYRAALTSVNGVNRRGCDFYALRRTKIEGGDRPIFHRILSGGLDGWALIDRHLAFLQNRYA